jgi:hypothetical protein
MKKVAICQSNYIPWKGYFDLIHEVDLFLFYDDVQFTVRDWRNRNSVKTPQGCRWLTIPVGAERNRRICDVTLSSGDWQARHWRTLRQCYGKAPCFRQYETFFDRVYLGMEWRTLSELNQFLITRIARDYLGIRTEVDQSSRYGVTSRKQERILDLVKAVGADVYVSGPAAKAYLDPERFRREGIEVVWKDYSGYPEYPQLYPPFEHGVTILDLLFHVGANASYYIWGWRADGRQAARAAR